MSSGSTPVTRRQNYLLQPLTIDIWKKSWWNLRFNNKGCMNSIASLNRKYGVSHGESPPYISHQEVVKNDNISALYHKMRWKKGRNNKKYEYKKWPVRTAMPWYVFYKPWFQRVNRKVVILHGSMEEILLPNPCPLGWRHKIFCVLSYLRARFSELLPKLI